MSTIIMEVYEAFRDAGTSEEKASAAAKALADYESRFAKLDSKLYGIKWMVGLTIALNIAILGLIANKLI